MNIPNRSANEGYKNSHEIDKAVKFLVSNINKYCKNDKPLISHCLRVGLYLDLQGWESNIVIAALLHDLVEDTKATIEDIKNEFGDRVAVLVSASTMDNKIADKIDGYKSNFEKAAVIGRDALVIRAADILDNSAYYTKTSDPDMYVYLIEKFKYFLTLSKPLIGDEKVYKELEKRFEALKTNPVKKSF